MSLHRLYAADAPQIARLESSTYSSSYRAGEAALAEDLAFADAHSENLSVGLFDKGKLVGFILAFYQEDREEVFESFGVSTPPGHELVGESIYFADVVVLPAYGRYFHLLMGRFGRELRRHYPELPIDAFAVTSAYKRWKRFARGLAGFGYKVTESAGLADETLDEPLRWLTLIPVAAAERKRPTRFPYSRNGRSFEIELIQTSDRWQEIAADWNRLLEETPGFTPFQTCEYLVSWWETFRLFGRLFVVTVYENDKLVMALPFQVSTSALLWQDYFCLEFVGDPLEVDRPKMLGAPDSTVAEVVACFLADRRDQWDLIVAYEQDLESILPAALRAVLDDGSCHIGEIESPSSPYISIGTSWVEYLKSRPRSKRKQLRRSLNRVRRAGDVQMITVETWPEVAEALERYAEVEARSWKPEKKLGVKKTKEHWHFYNEVVRQLGPAGEVHFRILQLNGKDIAATFGIVKNGRFASMHIAHDQEFDEFSPGVVLTNLELEEVFKGGDYVEFDFLGAFLSNKSSWATGIRSTIALHVYSKEPRLGLVYWAYFRAKPALRGFLHWTGLFGSVKAIARKLRKLFGKSNDE